MQDIFMTLEKLIAQLNPDGDVLEIGFGKSTKIIQKYRPKTHTIISKDPEARHWVEKNSAILIENIWQGALSKLGVFDVIFFGITDLVLPVQMKYTDSILDEFCGKIKDKKALSKFLPELEQNGQISKEQKEAMVKKYDLSFEKPPVVKLAGQMLPFLKLAVTSHMKKGSRFGCLLKNELDDPEFFNEIIVNPLLEVQMEGRVLMIEKMN